MDNRQLEQLILYVVYLVGELGGFTTTIRLVKFLYLIDLEHQRRYGRTLTGLRWVYHLYGPYAVELPAIGEGLGYQLEREEFVSTEGHVGKSLRVPHPQDLPEGLSFGTENMVKLILGVWATQSTGDLLRYVYQTEPMKAAKPRDALDFTAVPKGTRFYELVVPIQPKIAKRLQEAIRSRVGESETEYVRPSVVYDEVLREGLRTLEDEMPLDDLVGVVPKIDPDSLCMILSNED